MLLLTFSFIYFISFLCLQFFVEIGFEQQQKKLYDLYLYMSHPCFLYILFQFNLKRCVGMYFYRRISSLIFRVFSKKLECDRSCDRRLAADHMKYLCMYIKNRAQSVDMLIYVRTWSTRNSNRKFINRL